ncbi:MAG: DEAD/DEAH box helicase [Candidatus Pacebacteria bacterium]|nr:DEAD/DEAH box helicase [Candidatus Paceibacterota bacterium]MCF7862478.1 DEAD/DEAH box helicase [Candidatus Paceibacterota bacterium]
MIQKRNFARSSSGGARPVSRVARGNKSASSASSTSFKKKSFSGARTSTSARTSSGVKTSSGSGRSFGSSTHSSHSSFPRRESSFGGSRSFGGRFGQRNSGGGSRGGSSFGGGRRGGGRSGGRIDFSRFIKKAEKVEEKEYVSKHTFSDFPFHAQIQKNIAKKGYIHPRPIQDQAIPSVLEGKDVFGLANTGTGKTAAFLLPLIDKVIKDKSEKVLVLAPTRELAIQIEEELRTLASASGLYGVVVVGGLPIMKQIREVERGVSFVIGTPGRVMDLIKRKVLDLSTYKNVVLDEADRMLDMGFRDDMVTIIGKTAPERQTLFFSATLSAEIKKLSVDFLKNPVFISVVSGETAKNIDQDVVRTKSKEDKIEKLHELLNEEKISKVLIFREMKHSVDDLAKELSGRGFKVGGIHGDKRSRERIRILESFKKDHITILIATDVAARGLDIPDVSHVINYDIPQNYETYVHRIGRTGRSGKKGVALTFI